MKSKIAIIGLMAMSPILSYADYFSRGRLSDIDDGYSERSGNGVLYFCAVVLVVLLGFGVVYLWQAHKKTVIKILLTCLFIYIVLAIGNLIFYKCSRDNATSMATPSYETVEVESLFVEESDEWEDVQECAWEDTWEDNPPASDGYENDLLVAVTSLPSYSIYDLMDIVGMRASNTQFLSESQYAQSEWIQEHYTPEELHRTYIKLQRTWEVFLRCQGVNIHDPEIARYMMQYDMFDTDKPRLADAEDPQLILDLQKVPLQY